MSAENETQNSQEQETTEGTTTEETTTETQQETENKSLIEGVKTETVAEFVPLTADDITFPDGFTVDEPLRDEFLTIVNDQELSHKDRAQALNGLYVKAAQQASEASSKQWTETQETWQNEVKADTEIGGDKLTTTLSAVNKLVGEYGSPELLEVFALTGAGNNVHVIKFLNKVAADLGEGKPISSGTPVNQTADVASKLFPSMKGK